MSLIPDCIRLGIDDEYQLNIGTLILFLIRVDNTKQMTQQKHAEQENTTLGQLTLTM